MNLLCSSDHVNSVNSLSVHNPHPTKKKKQPLRSLSDPRCNSNETLSTSKTRVQEVRRPRAANPKSCRGCYKEDEEAVLHGATAWVCVDMLLNMKSEKKTKNKNKTSSC